MQNRYDDDDDNVVYKDVVIIGNGPSGICLSYMLAGNWPYYTGEPHPGDEMLTARLHFSTRPGNGECYEEEEEQADEEEKDVGKKENINDRWRQRNGRSDGSFCAAKSQGRGLARSTRCKLECLSSGLEGRVGGRPLALLMDQLQHPCVDAGLDVPSLLTWKSVEQHPEHKVIDHVVLGKDEPGGSWQSMDPNVLTISLNRWMSLPDLDIRQWETLIESEQFRQTTSTLDEPCPHAFQERSSACKTASRISVGTVAAYYRDYVRRKGLERYFRCGTIVTSVRPVRGTHANENYGWIVEGYEKNTGKSFRYRCKRAVLATGTTDLSNRLGIHDEDLQPDWITHDLNDVESRLDRLIEQHHGDKLEDQVDPVLVIGGGLTAADAIMAARFRGIPVLHAFRDSSNEWNKPDTKKIHNAYEKLQGLPSSMYPEYHKVYEMMADGGTNYPLYKALPGYSLVKFTSRGSDDVIDVMETDDRTVTLSAPDGRLYAFRVSIVAILIGYKPDLSYFENCAIGLGKFPDRPIDSKSNPIEVDDFTYEVIKAPRNGLYALGPLVGDNFVRYILGGAFGILTHILSTSYL
nr:PREDICTED: oxidative stress-induced growth inhibitor 2-like isoform X1 [Megachile rotundata]XP_012147401.1 PREDICTED: oxidative stress-induced growth inhibitor 2-like isoform X1 [Megachile rotundata]XP_012147402.1 PREDICTED: oxidative stress-induced growth inhibitor 2-like isoform X1 [Megachile rotundata]XP_012147403.1 PREDICTED: oxidative stress-induced growth inhibitor 2-like isoform X1 [Megachile rotundata]XP_012147405.1 PREDICTED: oxidative stress-induced growth inhibitor 2-like isoform 